MSENTTPVNRSEPVRSRLPWLLAAGVAGIVGVFAAVRSGTLRAEGELSHEMELGRQQQAKVHRLTPEEQFARGLKALNGDGQAQSYEIAAHWFRLAADRAQAPAQYELAKLLQFGLGVPADKAEARRYARAAASQGFAPAVTLAGVWETTTEGGDTAQGLLWLDAAADYGDPWAQASLALIYLEGRLEKADNFKALYWAERAHDAAPADMEDLRLLAWQKIPESSRQLALTVIAAQLGHDLVLPDKLNH